MEHQGCLESVKVWFDVELVGSGTLSMLNDEYDISYIQCFFWNDIKYFSLWLTPSWDYYSVWTMEDPIST